MYYRKALCAQQENVDQGTLQITVHSKSRQPPCGNALVRISYTGDPNSVIEEVRTDSSGNTPVLQLKSASSGIQPECFRGGAALCRIFHADQSRGFSPGGNAGTEVLPAVLAKQPVL